MDPAIAGIVSGGLTGLGAEVARRWLPSARERARKQQDEWRQMHLDINSLRAENRRLRRELADAERRHQDYATAVDRQLTDLRQRLRDCEELAT